MSRMVVRLHMTYFIKWYKFVKIAQMVLFDAIISNIINLVEILQRGINPAFYPLLGLKIVQIDN